MSFIKDKTYYTYKIKNIKKAISLTIQDIEDATEQRVIDAHTSYLVTINKELNIAKREFKSL